MPSLTFYGGIGEIGGNKILLEDKGTRIFLDFGKSFAARSKFYEWTERPRQANGIGDFLALGILPEIRGIYRSDLLKLARLPPEKDKSVDAIILSHAHSDHADYISFIREDIQLFMGQTTLDIICGLEEEKNANVEFEITNFKKRPSDRHELAVKRDIQTFRTGDTIKIDSIEIEPVHVDHSLPGCYGFVIRTSTSTVVYSGISECMGIEAISPRISWKRQKLAKPDVMLCEGTRIE